MKAKGLTTWAKTTFPASAIRSRTGLIFAFGISILILATVAVTYWINIGINHNAHRIELLDDMDSLRAGWQGNSPVPADLDNLNQQIDLLLEGGSTTLANGELVRLPSAGEPELVSAMEAARSAVIGLRSSLSIEEQAQLRLDLDNAMTVARRTVELHRADNLGMARGMYAALFISTTCFLLIGLWFTEELIARPLEDLVKLNYRIAAGDLDTPFFLSESDEFEELARSFEAMRLELRESRERLSLWTSELEARVTQRTQQLAALSQVVTAASRALELDQVLRTALDQSLKVVGLDTGGIWLVDEATGELSLAASQGMSDYLRENVLLMESGEGVTGRAARSGETIVLEDIAQSSQEIQMIASSEGLRSLVAVPIKVHNRVVGVLDVMTHQKRTYAAEEIALLTSIGQQIGIGVENAGLIEEIRQQSERVASLQERQWISAELHDGLLQTLGYLHLRADQLENQALSFGLPDMAQQMAHQREVLEQTSRDIRNFITNLQAPPPPLQLREAMQKMITAFSLETGPEARPDNRMEVRLRMTDVPVRLKADHVAHLVRIAREALINAARHGQAQRAVITCTVHGSHGELSVQDNGEGFHADQLPEDGREHLGLDIMRARAVRIGGALSVTSTPGEGTCVTVKWKIEG